MWSAIPAASRYRVTAADQILMNGLDMLIRSMSMPTSGSPGGKRFQYGNLWQYHPRSDRHSKIACWSVIFDLLRESSLLRSHVAARKVAVGINHPMRDFAQNRVKNLDLVICRVSASDTGAIRSFADLTRKYVIILSEEERGVLEQFPKLPIAKPTTVLVALEAKACMTEFGKARPRLYDELNSSHLTIHGDTNSAIAAGFAMINIAETFISPLRNPWPLAEHDAFVSRHRQPGDARSVVEKVLELPRRSDTTAEGFDAFGIAIVDCANDGRPVSRFDEPLVSAAAGLAYHHLVGRLAHLYATRFHAI
jgi:hypothetical protein